MDLHQKSLVGGKTAFCTKTALKHRNTTTLLSCRFNHKSPEDPAEVPGGFLTDINKVSKFGYKLEEYVNYKDANQPSY